jgi:hypothetical protein
MVDHRLRPPIVIDLHTAMGDPLGADPRGVPRDTEARTLLTNGIIDAAQYWYLRGLRRYLARDFAGTADAMNLALLHNPRFSEAHFLKGVSQQLIAIQVAEKSPDFPERLPPRAHSLLLKARWSLLIAVDMNPEDEEARTYLQGIEALLR